MQVVWLWPNVDAGSDDISKGLRVFRERHKPDYIHFFRNFGAEDYARRVVLLHQQRGMPRGQLVVRNPGGCIPRNSVRQHWLAPARPRTGPERRRCPVRCWEHRGGNRAPGRTRSVRAIAHLRRRPCGRADHRSARWGPALCNQDSVLSRGTLNRRGERRHSFVTS